MPHATAGTRRWTGLPGLTLPPTPPRPAHHRWCPVRPTPLSAPLLWPASLCCLPSHLPPVTPPEAGSIINNSPKCSTSSENTPQPWPWGYWTTFWVRMQRFSTIAITADFGVRPPGIPIPFQALTSYMNLEKKPWSNRPLWWSTNTSLRFPASVNFYWNDHSMIVPSTLQQAHLKLFLSLQIFLTSSINSHSA